LAPTKRFIWSTNVMTAANAAKKGVA